MAWLLYVYRILMCPKLGGERHLEVEKKFGEVLEAFGPDGPRVFPLP